MLLSEIYFIGGQTMSKDSKIPELQNLPDSGLLRLNQILRFIPVSRSSWWQGVKTGRFPRPLKLGVRTTAWRAADIQDLIKRGTES
jgi:prophage regulatory protein